MGKRLVKEMIFWSLNIINSRNLREKWDFGHANDIVTKIAVLRRLMILFSFEFLLAIFENNWLLVIFIEIKKNLIGFYWIE